MFPYPKEFSKSQKSPVGGSMLITSLVITFFKTFIFLKMIDVLLSQFQLPIKIRNVYSFTCEVILLYCSHSGDLSTFLPKACVSPGHKELFSSLA